MTVRPGDPVAFQGHFGCVTDVYAERGVAFLRLAERQGMPGRMLFTSEEIAGEMSRGFLEAAAREGIVDEVARHAASTPRRGTLER